MIILGFSIKNKIFILLTVILATIGSYSGSIFAYILGYRYGEGLVLKYGRPFKINKEKLEKTKSLLERHEVIYLLIYKFIPIVRIMIPYVCGITKINKRKFFIYNLISTVIWCTTFTLVGYLLGDKWHVVLKLMNTFIFIILLVLLFIFVVFKFFNKHKRVIISISIPLFIFIRFCYELITKELQPFDNAIYNFISKIISEDMTGIMILISNLGSAGAFLIISIVCMIVFWKNEKYSFYSKMIAVNWLFTAFLNGLFKIIFHRDRPNILRLITESGYSFPSGHSMISISFYGFIIYLCFKYCKKPWNYLVASILSILIFLIGVSRIYLGVHYASDVIAGFSAGLAWLIATILGEAINSDFQSLKIYNLNAKK
jgi:undecaprenyl-diphosphatase